MTSWMWAWLQCIQRSLETLASEGKIKEKVYGKQKVGTHGLLWYVVYALVGVVDRSIQSTNQYSRA